MSDTNAAPRAPLSDFLHRLASSDPDSWAKRLREDQQLRWQAGDLIRVEDYLDGFPQLTEYPDALLDVIYGEMLLREADGELPRLAELQERFPAHREALARQWEVHQLLAGDSMYRGSSKTRSAPGTSAGQASKHEPLVRGSVSPFPTLTEVRPSNAPTISGYDVLQELGRGGMGIVYLARQRSLNRLVAIKMITPERSLSAPQVARIRAEAELIARLQHPNVVSIYRVGLYEGMPYLVLEYVPGGSLAQRQSTGPWPAAAASELVESLARTLAVVHEQGIVHRDLKPANVLLGSGGVRSGESSNTTTHHSPLTIHQPKIVDFGLAKTLDEAQPPVDRAVTQAGEVVGTPLYMAPEQASGQADAVGPATDQHALGVILYELLTGTVPFNTDNVFDMLAQIAFTRPVVPSRLARAVSADLDAIVLRCLAKKPGERYASTLDLAEDLYRVRHGFPSRARKVGTTERMWLWSKLQPVVAGLMLAVSLALVAGVATIAFQWRRAEVALEAATVARAQAEEAHDKEAHARNEEADARSEVQRKNTLLQYSLTRNQVVLCRSLIALAETERLRKNLSRAEEHLDVCPPEARSWEWHFLARLCSMRLTTFEGVADDAFVSTAISPDGRWLAGALPGGMGGRPASVRLWEGRASGAVHILEGSTCVAFHPSGGMLATCKPGGGVLLYPLSSPKAPPVALDPGKNGAEKFHSLAFSPDGQFLAAERPEGVKLWQFQRGGKPLGPMTIPIPGTGVRLRAIAFNPDSKVLAIAARRQVIFWDLVQRRFVPATPQPRGKSPRPQPLRLTDPDPKVLMSALAWVSSDLLIVGTANGTILVNLYDGTTAKAAFRLEGHAGAIEGLAAGGGLLASVSSDGSCRLWDMKTRQEVVRLPGFRTVALDAQGMRLLSAGRDRRIALWKTRPRPPASPQTWHSAPVLALAFSPDTSVLATGSFDGKVSFRSPREGHHKMQEDWRAPEKVLALAYHPAGRLLAAGLARGTSSSLIIRHVTTGRQAVLSGHAGAASAVAFSVDGKWLASAGAGGFIRLWQGSPDDTAWRPVGKLAGHSLLVSGLAFGPDSLLASTARDGKVMIWNVETGKLLREARVRPDVPDRVDAGKLGMSLPFPGVAFSPDGKQVATGGCFGGDESDTAPGVVLLDVETGAEHKLVGHTGGVQSLTFSPDGSRLATSGRDGVVRLWDPRRREEVLTLSGYVRSALTIAFSPDGRFLAASSWDNTVVVHRGSR
jgi:WD40 repeat protein/serine/threonine protein kinase